MNLEMPKRLMILNGGSS